MSSSQVASLETVEITIVFTPDTCVKSVCVVQWGSGKVRRKRRGGRRAKVCEGKIGCIRDRRYCNPNKVARGINTQVVVGRKEGSFPT